MFGHSLGYRKIAVVFVRKSVRTADRPSSAGILGPGKIDKPESHEVGSGLTAIQIQD